jgi:pyruvate/2-oxoglutarate/acetoin dehydrogenase E1 component
VEEGSSFAGFGAELIAALMEKLTSFVKIRRIGALPVPIPSVKSLETAILPTKERILKKFKNPSNNGNITRYKGSLIVSK